MSSISSPRSSIRFEAVDNTRVQAPVDTTAILKSLADTRAQLREGGPDIDSLLIARYLGDKLSPQENKRVETLVQTYRTWFDTMLKVL